MSADKPATRPSKAEMTRRRNDSPGSRAVTKAHTRTAVKTPPAPGIKAGGRLRTEVVLPVGVGAVVICAALGLVAVGSVKIGAPLPVTLVGAGVLLVAGLVTYVAWVVENVVARPLAKVRDAMQEMEGGNYEARLAAGGAAELCEVQQGFNRMATIVGHQRERLKVAAATDGLTGLGNHRHFHEQLRIDIQDARENGTPMAVVALDIDGFKKLNDDRGHGRGDESLKLAGEALERAVRGDDLVARLGGDDFVMILRGADGGYAREVAERAREAMARSLPEELELTVSAGFVCFPDSADEDANLSELANSALDVAKRAGGNQTRKYDPDQVSAIPSIKQQRAEIDALLAMEEPITPVYQPLVQLSTGRLIGFEALSRFNTEKQRSPDAWFNQAARCGRGLALEMAAINAALAGARSRPSGTYLSLNFSPSALGSPKLMSILPRNMSDIVIEVTEHELAADDAGLEEGLARMRARGARIAVDDAGAGYAGLNQVMRVQPDLIKLDRSLIEGVHSDSAKSALVEFFVMFARRVGAAVCTEGIETLDELRTLINLGVTYGQGFLLGRPGEPWVQVSPEISRALATGALRSHVQPVSRGPAPAPVAPAASAGTPRRPASSPHAGPVNRRLSRY
ncbi:MAG: diguanylate cyclase [Thermoleophilaceae bacterium]|nr:diguanylate cyclase [Thermoleophilaceae bacterium]